MIQDLSTQDKGKGSGYITEDGKGIQKKKGEGGGSLSLIAKSWYEGDSENFDMLLRTCQVNMTKVTWLVTISFQHPTSQSGEWPSPVKNGQTWVTLGRKWTKGGVRGDVNVVSHPLIFWDEMWGDNGSTQGTAGQGESNSKYH